MGLEGVQCGCYTGRLRRNFNSFITFSKHAERVIQKHHGKYTTVIIVIIILSI